MHVSVKITAQFLTDSLHSFAKRAASAEWFQANIQYVKNRSYLQGTRKILTKELIWAIDADTPSEMLIYTVLRADTDAGHIERVTYPFRPIDTFTQAELMQGLIAYVHRGNGNDSLFSNYKTRRIFLRILYFAFFLNKNFLRDFFIFYVNVQQRKNACSVVFLLKAIMSEIYIYRFS